MDNSSPTKNQVNLGTYRKYPRRLAKDMEMDLKQGLSSLLEAVKQCENLRLDIRDRRFNIYYRGGNLLLVDGRKLPYHFYFDKRYTTGGVNLLPTDLPESFGTPEDSKAWSQAFPALMAIMDAWWIRNPKTEREHCQAMAKVNTAERNLPNGDYFIIDIEYQWARMRFDLVAAKRNPTETDPVGWVEPNLVFIEVKSELGACTGTSGIKKHTDDYQKIINADDGRRAHDIKHEFENVIRQKMRLGLVDNSFRFEKFSDATIELMVVLIGLESKMQTIEPILALIANEASDTANISLLKLEFPNYIMYAKDSKKLTKV